MPKKWFREFDKGTALKTLKRKSRESMGGEYEKTGPSSPRLRKLVKGKLKKK